MADDKNFQMRMQKIDELVRKLDTIADPTIHAGTKELVQLLMDLHGKGLERILDIVFQSGAPGQQIIDDLGQDALVSSLLILYGLHPEDLHTRVEQKLKDISSKIHKMGAAATLVSAHEGIIRVQIHVDGHSCGSTSRTVQTIVEEAIVEAAPDLKSLVVEVGEEPASAGFIAVEKLLAASHHVAR